MTDPFDPTTVGTPAGAGGPAQPPSPVTPASAGLPGTPVPGPAGPSAPPPGGAWTSGGWSQPAAGTPTNPAAAPGGWTQFPPGSVPPGYVPPGSVPPPGGQEPPWGTGPAPAPARTAQPGLVFGVILVIVGGALLVGRLVDVSTAWPAWLVVPGLAMLVGSLFIPPRGGLGLAIPGAIIAMLGIVLGVQEAYGLYSTWAYAWALVAPTSVGLAMLVYGLARRDTELAADGVRTTMVGVALFLGFGLFFEGVLGLNGHKIPNLDEVLPYLAIGFGAFLIVLSLFTGGRRRHRQEGTRA